MLALFLSGYDTYIYAQVRWYYNDYNSGGGDEDARRPYVASTASTTSRGRATEMGSSSAAFRAEGSMALVCPLLIAALVRRVMLV